MICLKFPPYLPAQPTILFYLTAISILTELRPIVYRGGISRGSISQTISTAIFIFATFILPPISSIFVISTGTIISDITERRSWYRILFNTSFRIISFGILSLIIHAQSSRAEVIIGANIGLLLTIFVIHVATQIILVGTVIALTNGQSIFTGWLEAIKCSSTYDMALFPYGLMLVWLWQQSFWFFVVGLLPLLAIRRSFIVHASLLEEKAETARLAEQQKQLQDATTMLLSSKDMHAQLDMLLRHLMGMFPVIHSNVVIWDSKGHTDQIVTRGDAGPELPLESWIDNLRRISEARRVVWLDHEFVTRATDGHPVLIVPLVTPDDTVGCLLLVGEPEFTLDEQGEHLIETFAAQAALAIYQARLISQLQSSQVQIVQSERLAAIGTLAAGVAHEFNNLLAGISGVAQLALMENTPEEQQSALATVVQASQQGSSITRGLLTFARHLEPKREVADIRNAIDPVLSMLQVEFRRANITLITRLEPTVPLICDIGMLAQVMLNLVTNAIDAMYPGGGTLTVTLCEERGSIKICVSDTGSGISEHVRERIFEPFVTTKLSSDGKLHGGTGLGLAISYGIVTDHGGTIHVASQPGVGTTMTIRLPIQATRAHQPIMPLAHQPSLSMLVVDDEPLIAKTLHGMLVHEGYTAQWFSEPGKALEALEHEPIDVIFADLMMPQIDGITLLQRARERLPMATQIVLTGQIDQKQLERAREIGVDAIIEKPFSIDTVRSVLNTACFACHTEA